MSVHLHIDRLIVDRDVLAGESTRDLGTALEHELARVLEAPDALAAIARLGAVDALSTLSLANARAGQGGLAARIAATVGDGLGVAGATATRTSSSGSTRR